MHKVKAKIFLVRLKKKLACFCLTGSTLHIEKASLDVFDSMTLEEFRRIIELVSFRGMRKFFNEASRGEVDLDKFQRWGETTFLVQQQMIRRSDPE